MINYTMRNPMLLVLMLVCSNAIGCSGQMNSKLDWQDVLSVPGFVEKFSDILSDILSSDFGRAYTLIYDNSTARMLPAITSKMTWTGTGTYRYIMDMRCSSLNPDLLSDNILVIAGAECLYSLLRKVAIDDMGAAKGRYLRHKSHWFIVTFSDNVIQVQQSLVNFDHVTVLTFNNIHGDKLEYNIMTLTWKPQGREWETIHNVEKSESSNLFPNMRFGLNGRQLLVTTLSWPGFIIKERKEDGSVTYSGFCVDVMDQLSSVSNFTYVIADPPDGQWGSIVNGQWTGMVKQLMTHEVDIAATALTVNFARVEVIDFVSPSFFYDTKDIMYRTPTNTQSRWRLLLDVYKPEVLICLAIATIVWTLFLTAVENQSRTLTTYSKLQLFSRIWSYFEQLWCSLLHQSGILRPCSWSGHVLLCWWLMFAMLVSALYTASLMALLAVPITHTPFSSLHDMLQSTDYTWGFVGGGSIQTTISTSPDPGLQALWQSIVDLNQSDSRTLSKSVDMHVQRVLSENYAYVVGHEKYGPGVDCHVTYVGENLYQYEYSMGLPRGSPLKKDFDDVLSRMLESGLLRKLSKKWLDGAQTCADETDTSRSVVLSDVIGLFCIGGAGLTLALFVLLFECLLYRFRKNATHSVST